MLDRKIAPPLHQFISFRLQQPQKRVLDNGIRLFFFENPQLDLIHFTLRIKAGSIFEHDKLLANSTYSLLIESVRGKTPADVEDFLDYYGAVFNASVNLEYVSLQFIIPKSSCRTVLPFICSFIISPGFQEDSLSRYKERKGKELEYNQRKVSFRSGQWMYNTLLNSSIPAGTILEKKHIESLSVLQMEEYHRQTFCSENMTLFLTGNVDEEIMEKVCSEIGRIPSNMPADYPDVFAASLPENRLIFEKREDSMQSSIILCRRGLAYEDEERRPFSVLSTLLGGYFGSRLMQNLREKNGFTYGVYCSASYFGSGSLFYLNSDVNIDKTDMAIEECRKEMLRLIDEEVGVEELDTVKNYMAGSLLRKLDGTVNYMREYALWDSAGLDEQELERVMTAIRKADAQYIRYLAGKYLNPADFATIVVGNMLNK